MNPSNAIPTFDLDRTLVGGPELLPRFRSIVDGIDDVPRGVLVSEIFFIVATLGAFRPRQIIESGRAMGQSTLLLGRCFPDTSVLSIEYDADHPDATVALKRLAGMANVSCLFGDARRLMPGLMLAGDVAVIDGPKELRAVKLAMDVLRGGGMSVVFIHDCYHGSAIRAFLQRHVPWAFFSDDPRFVSRYCHLDHDRGRMVDSCWSDVHRIPADRSYGGTFACVPARRGFPRHVDYRRRVLARWMEQFAGRRRRRDHPCEQG